MPGSGAKADSFAAQVFVDALDLGGDKAPVVEIPCSAASDGEVNDWLLVYLQRLIGVERPSLLRRLQQEAAPPSASEDDVERWEFFTPKGQKLAKNPREIIRAFKVCRVVYVSETGKFPART